MLSVSTTSSSPAVCVNQCQTCTDLTSNKMGERAKLLHLQLGTVASEGSRYWSFQKRDRRIREAGSSCFLLQHESKEFRVDLCQPVSPLAFFLRHRVASAPAPVTCVLLHPPSTSDSCSVASPPCRSLV